MSINQKMNNLGDIGANGYDPSSEVLTQLVARTRRQRAVRKGTTALAGSVGAMAMALVTVQVVAAVEQDPAFQDRNFPDNVPVVEKIIEKPAAPEPVDIKPIIEKLEAAAQEKADAEKKAAEEAAAKKAAEEKAAKEAAEKEAARKAAAEKEASEPKETTPPKECVDDTTSYEYKWYKCSKGQWFPKEGWMELGGEYQRLIMWTDAATGNSHAGAYFASHKKLVITVSTTDKNWLGYYYIKNEGAKWENNTCYGTLVDGVHESCYANKQ